MVSIILLVSEATIFVSFSVTKFRYYGQIFGSRSPRFLKKYSYLPLIRSEIIQLITRRITLSYILLKQENKSLDPLRILQAIRQNCVIQLTVPLKALSPASWFISMYICYPSSRRQFSTFLQLQINGNSARLSAESTTAEIEISFYFIPTYISILIRQAVPQEHRSTPGIRITPQMAYCVTIPTSGINIHFL